MALVTRYFSDTSAGTGDGTTWANRAAYVSAGVISAVITAFAFNGSDAMLALVEGGKTYARTAVLQGSSFSVAVPTILNPLFINSCDSSGQMLFPPFLGWTSDTPCNWDGSLAIEATTTNIGHYSIANVHLSMMKLTASLRTGSMVSIIGSMDWLSFVNSSSNVSAICFDVNSTRTNNISIQMTGSIYAYGFQAGANYMDNVRIQGNPSASSGTRHGISIGGTTASRSFSRLCVFDHPGDGMNDGNTNVNLQTMVTKSVFVNNAGNGLKGSSTASQVLTSTFRGCMITGNGAWGIDANASNYNARQNRLRHNTSGNMTNFGNYPSTLTNDVSNIYASQALADAAEYADSVNKDFRIKAGSPLSGKGYGVSDQSGGGPIGNAGLHGGFI